MRCCAYLLPAEAYRAVEARLLETLQSAERDRVLALVEAHDLCIELLGGEWRLLFEAASDYHQIVDSERGITRMMVGPDEVAGFVHMLRDPERAQKWQPIAFGLAELVDALPADVDLFGLVFVEDADDWMWAEPVSEIVAIRPEVYDLVGPWLRSLLERREFTAAARLAEDHSESSIAFSPAQWATLLGEAQEKVPELLSVFENLVSSSADYTAVRESLSLIAHPRLVSNLDAWLRVHAGTAQYVLYFRDATLERLQNQGIDLAAVHGAPLGDPNMRTQADPEDVLRSANLPPKKAGPSEVHPRKTSRSHPHTGGAATETRATAMDAASVAASEITIPPPARGTSLRSVLNAWKGSTPEGSDPAADGVGSAREMGGGHLVAAQDESDEGKGDDDDDGVTDALKRDHEQDFDLDERDTLTWRAGKR